MAPTTPPSTRGKLALSLGLIVVSFIYALWQKANGSPSVTSTASISPGQSYQAASEALLQTLLTIPTATGTPAAGSGTMMPRPMPSAPMMRLGAYKDGSYTGSPADAYYGTVQVKAVIRNGKIVDVVFLDRPHTHENSIFINGQAMPLLTQEAIQAQSAQVDGVSGASFTSAAFKESLASALALAK